MPQISGKSKSDHSYDAIVISSGISGGRAAKELCEKGLKTLVLERGIMVEHLQDYPTATMNPWEFPHRDDIPAKFINENPLITKSSGFGEDTAHFFIRDKIICPGLQKRGILP
jgi:choline dehydrogenase-like flavoprotein